MITIRRLKELIKDLPDDAKCYAYEGEETGIGIVDSEDIHDGKSSWWINAGQQNEIDTYTEGFEKEK